MASNDSESKEQPTFIDTGFNREDGEAALVKGVFSLCPVVGPLAGEVISHLIPNQRWKRIQKLLQKLESRISHLEQEQLDERFRDSQFIDLLEDGFHQAARALKEERLEYIAALVANGVTSEGEDIIRIKKLMNLLDTLNDVEVLHLINYSYLEFNDQSFMEKHPDILQPLLVTLESDTEEREKACLQESYKQQLANLGLVQPRFKKPKRDELPEFDEKTGKMKATGYHLTPLGRLLLRYIEQGIDIEGQKG